MTGQHTHASTRKGKVNALGPGIMMISAAVGDSHLIASTQANTLYGWQLALIIILTNLFKYPFFRFDAHYALDTDESLIEGYAGKSRVYLRIFLVLCITSATINAGAVAIATAAIVKMTIPSLTFDTGMVSVIIMVSCLLILASGRYKALNNVSKAIIVNLTIATVAAAAVAMSRDVQMEPDLIGPTPWALAGLGFLIVLMGWMPAPIEISAVNSLWVTEKQRINPSSYRNGVFDFSVGYITNAILAVVFLALGAYVQYGNDEGVQMASDECVGQLINMYAVTIGDWSHPLVAFIAFTCMYGTIITAVDGYAHAIAKPVRLLRGKDKTGSVELFAWNIWVANSDLAVVFWFSSAMAELFKFAMIIAFVAAPVFTRLSYRLVEGDKRHKLTMGTNFLVIIGLIYLTGFTVLFLLNQTGILAAPKQAHMKRVV